MDPLLAKIRRLNEIGVALSAEKDTPRLLERILVGAKELTGADGGTLYSVGPDDRLHFEILHNDSLGIAQGGTSGTPVALPPIPLHTPEGAPNTRMVAAYAVLRDATVNIPDAYAEKGFDFSGTREFDRRTGYRSRSFLTVPLKDHEGEIIGALQLINARAAGGAVVPFSREDQHLTESLASQAAAAVTKQRLITGLKELFESFVRAMAVAIDEKSPYTAGHCRRVAELALMLADAACEADSGSLRDFRLTEEERVELEMAAWLHDCGKVTVPEHVIDKATKLQGVFDRIHLVDARIEILKREAEIRFLRRRIAALEKGRAPGDDGDERRLAAELRELEDDRRFLHACNDGREFLPDADRDRLRRVARRCWTGPGGVPQPLLADDEVENLSIRRGTLNERERRLINNHVTATLKILETLPYPRHLRRIPEIAGGHHERVDGKGYPRGLKGEEMSVQARIMAVADIFEALTARDRPYKKGKSLEEALGILAAMKDEGHIDPEIFEVFVRSGVHRRYAERHLAAGDGGPSSPGPAAPG
ncbi:GAF domain-containing protein [Dissulfurirhabdus thermomarina]|uniref:GAF domain-containing protein n=1 Tax=Dissulfurirhabdus thermomarina TaxID=1765737 RepID=A0A6N9TNV5_DISTH|nr:HD family phosphohydrolase [Dissulfurirhabdus thermomarina]NDY42738.1 GAF domain-containing protein [Dissulfurirhabdus thermomarina]NMX22555.1 GAF domain-containing protein [Dissulfurirhabdus thermomarina]